MRTQGQCMDGKSDVSDIAYFLNILLICKDCTKNCILIPASLRKDLEENLLPKYSCMHILEITFKAQKLHPYRTYVTKDLGDNLLHFLYLFP